MPHSQVLERSKPVEQAGAQGGKVVPAQASVTKRRTTRKTGKARYNWGRSHTVVPQRTDSSGRERTLDMLSSARKTGA